MLFVLSNRNQKHVWLLSLAASSSNTDPADHHSIMILKKKTSFSHFLKRFQLFNSSVPFATARCLLQLYGSYCNCSTVPAATARCLLQLYGAYCNCSTVPAATARCLLQQHCILSAAIALCVVCCNSTLPVAKVLFVVCCNSSVFAATVPYVVCCNQHAYCCNRRLLKHWNSCCNSLLYGFAYFLPILQFCLLQQHVGVACCNNMMPLLLREHIACCNIKLPAASAW
jgi:hypothetical protein